MDQSTLLAGLAIAVVVVGAFLMRGGKRDDDAATTRAPEDAVSEGAVPEPEDLDFEDDDEDDDDANAEVVAVTVDGCALLPDRHAVRLLPPEEEGEAWKAGQRTSASHARGQRALDMSWHAGDFTGGRVTRGNGEEPWRMEALGRDGEYTVFGFETEDAARAALQLFESRGVIRLGEDEDGRPMPPSAEQFAEARRIYEETEQALAMEPGVDDEERGR